MKFDISECIDVNRNYIPWASELFNECVFSNRQIASLVLGNVSLGLWMMAQFPQLLKNYKRKSVDGLSKGFIYTWFFGDFTNLIGCILTGQLPFQVRMAYYFVFVDILTLAQYFYYSRIYKQQNSENDEETNALLENDGCGITPPGTIAAIIASSVIMPVEGHVIQLEYINNDSWGYKMGMYISWICTCTYLSSRIPQILLNRRIRNVDGLALPMFCCIVLANMTYSLSIVLSDDGWTGNEMFWKKSMPFLIGSSGTIIFDFIIFLQFIIYKNI